MKNFSLITIILFSISLFQFGCDSTDPNNDKQIAYLELYWNNQVYYSETLTEEDDGFDVEVILPDDSIINLDKFAYNGQSIPNEDEFWNFGCLASKIGYYSLIPIVDRSDTLRIYGDTGFTPVEEGKVCGLVYNERMGALSNIELNVLSESDSSLVTTISTDQHGRYVLDLVFGDYLIASEMEIVEFTVENLYHDIELNYFITEDKPNIYIYPEKESSLDVTINFPMGGRVTVSDPAYGSGWKDIIVTPDGMINGKHDFLFYESATAEFDIPDYGWVIAQSELEEFFVKNLKETGFVGREIDDFIEFWLPIFKDNKYYEIYPLYQKQLDEKIVLNFSKKPDNMQRLIYIIKGREDNKLKLDTPKIPAFERNGFVVTEWGVIRK